MRATRPIDDIFLDLTDLVIVFPVHCTPHAGTLHADRNEVTQQCMHSGGGATAGHRPHI